MKRFFTQVLVISALAFLQSAAHSSGDSARAKSVYFIAISDYTNNGTSRIYAQNWRVWLQLHRAIEKKPDIETPRVSKHS